MTDPARVIPPPVVAPSAPSLTGAAAEPRPRRVVGTVGAVMCLIGVGLPMWGTPLAAALGIQLFALAFWLWARASDDALEQVPRWHWLQRPATALWLAYAIPLCMPAIARDPVAQASMRFAVFDVTRAIAVTWAGLELVAALPLARPYSDFPGPAASLKAWIPVSLPCAGFIVLWSQRAAWQGVPGVARIAIALLAITALLSAMRAFARRGWTASLRWLAVTLTSLALVPLAARRVSAQADFLLWLSAVGGPAFVLAGELAGATPRRGRVNARLWRLASAVSIGVLAWPALLVFLELKPEWLVLPAYFAGATAVLIATWIMVARLEVAPERRRLLRPGSGVIAGRVVALFVLLLGPLGLVLAWWAGFEPRVAPSALALFAPIAGAVLALAPRQKPVRALALPLRRLGARLRAIGGAVFRVAVRIERGALATILAVTRAVTAPLRDLHTGDPQEYLLLVAGVAVLALLLPLLR